MIEGSLEKMICRWRVTRGVPSGVHVWFDPNVESVRLYRVPTSEQQSVSTPDGAVDAGVGPGYLDKVASVSASVDSDEDSLEVDHSEQLDGFEELDELPF